MSAFGTKQTYRGKLTCPLSGVKRTCRDRRWRIGGSLMTQSRHRPDWKSRSATGSCRIAAAVILWPSPGSAARKPISARCALAGLSLLLSDCDGSLTPHQDTEGPHVLSSDFAVYAEPEEFRDLSRQG